MAAATSPSELSISDLGVLASGPEHAGETIVFLHGWGASKELWWNTMAGLSDVARGFSLDLPGTGGTPLGHRMESMSEMASWVEGVCDRLKLQKVTVIGHSLGGNLAAQMAIDFPDRVHRLILVDAALDTRSLPRRVYWTQSPNYGLQAIWATKVMAGPLAGAGRRVPHTHGGGFWGPLARRAGLLIASNKSDTALQTQLRLLCANHLTPDLLSVIKAPMMIVHGGLDGVIPVATARAYAAALPGCTLKVFPKSHHCPMDQEPPDFIASLRKFIVDNPPAHD